MGTKRFIGGPQRDTALIAAAHAGDAAAWEAFVERHAQAVWDIVRRHGLDRADAAIASAATWLRCADHLPQIATLADPVGWLFDATALEARRAGADRVVPSGTAWPHVELGVPGAVQRAV